MRQAGLPDFTLASLIDDQAVLEIAREAAEKVMEKDPTLQPVSYTHLTLPTKRIV